MAARWSRQAQRLLQGGPVRQALFGRTSTEFRQRVFFAGLGLGGVASWVAFRPLLEVRREMKSSANSTSVFDHMAPTYDQMMDAEEVGKITEMRQRLLRQTEGDVLEMAVGTGRNFAHYPEGDTIKSVTAVDVSEAMLEEAKKKLSRPEFAELVPKFKFVKVDAAKLPFADNSFDTVVETMGLCSYDDPVAALKEMGRVSRPGARILLFEHGTSDNIFVRMFQQFRGVAHKKKYGCDYNRDIQGLIEQSGLKVRSLWTADYSTLVFCVAYKEFDYDTVFKAFPDPMVALPKDLKPEDFF